MFRMNSEKDSNLIFFSNSRAEKTNHHKDCYLHQDDETDSTNQYLAHKAA